MWPLGKADRGLQLTGATGTLALEEADIEQFGVHQYFKEDCFYKMVNDYFATGVVSMLCGMCQEDYFTSYSKKITLKHDSKKMSGKNDTKTVIRVTVCGAVVQWLGQLDVTIVAELWPKS